MSYIDIPNADVAAGAPVTTALMTALRDNPIAIAEGTDTNAPGVSIQALECAIGDNIRFEHPFVNDQGAPGSSAPRYYTVRSGMKGSVRITGQFRRGGVTVLTVRGEIIQNDTVLDGAQTSGTSYVSLSADVLDLKPGDLIGFRFFRVSGSGDFDARNMRIRDDGVNLFWPINRAGFNWQNGGLFDP